MINRSTNCDVKPEMVDHDKEWLIIKIFTENVTFSTENQI